MAKNFPIIFGGAIAYILLLLYAGTMYYMATSVIEHGQAEAPKDGDGKTLPKDPLKFNDGVKHVVTIVGGLVSALVVSKLTITKPGENPGLMRTAAGTTPLVNSISATLALGYLIVWLVVGLAALVVGVMLYPGVSSTLADIGTTWLGLAVASGYAYFGLDPK